ncbi:MAG: transaldolase family protein, partial [Chloroflexota bacterium]
DGAPPLGLCGSGLADAVAILLRRGLLLPTGRLLAPDQLPADLPPELRRRLREDKGQRRFVLCEDGASATIALTQGDIRQVQLAKAEADPGRAAEIRKLRGLAAVANSKILYAHYRQIFASSQFQALQKKGAHIQRVLWGSTSTKDPAYSDIKYVAELIGRDTINTIPPQTITAFKDHGVARPTLETGLEEARRVVDRLAALGIDLDVVCQQVQDEGVKAFADSFDALISTLESKRKSLLAGRPR